MLTTRPGITGTGSTRAWEERRKGGGKRAYLEEWARLKSSYARAERDYRGAATRLLRDAGAPDSVAGDEPGAVTEAPEQLGADTSERKGSLSEAEPSSPLSMARALQERVRELHQASRPNHIHGYSAILAVKALMEEIEAELGNGKQHVLRGMQELEERERRLQCELSRALERAQAWSAPPSAAAATLEGSIPSRISEDSRAGSKTTMGISERQEMEARVQEYAHFLARHGGPWGGWEAEEHATFMRLLGRLQRSVARRAGHVPDAQDLAALCVSSLPGLAVEEIARHVEWTREHERLLARKREALEFWRLLKTAKTKAEAERAMSPDQAQREQEARHRAQEQERERRGRIKAQLAAWKEAESSDARTSQEQAEIALRKQQDRVRFLQHQEHLKAKLRLHAEATATKSNLHTSPAPEAERLSAADSARIQARNTGLLARRAIRQAGREQAAAERQQRIEQLLQAAPHRPVHVVADRERLLRPTQGFLLKRVPEPPHSVPLAVASAVPHQPPRR